MASLSRSGSSRRKAAPGKLRIVMKGFSSKSQTTDGSDEEDDLNSEEMENEDNIQEEENGIPDDLPEGTVVVQPEAVEEEEDTPQKKKKEVPMRIDTSVLDNVSCTACGRQLNPYKNSALQKHPELKVIICRRCCKFLSSGDIAKDKDGADEQCRWCGEGGRLVVCDDCSSAFCKSCVMRNFNRSEFNNINGQGKWKCYLCNKAPMQGLRENYRNVRDTLKALQAKEKAKAEAKKDAAPTASNGMKKSQPPVSRSTASAASMSSSPVVRGTKSQKPLSSNSSATVVSSDIGDEMWTIGPSDLQVGSDSVDVIMDKLSTATDTFKGTLRALRAQFGPVSPEAEEDGGQFRFTLSSRMNVREKKQRCAKALNSTLHTYFKSLKVILSGASEATSTEKGSSQSSTSVSKTKFATASESSMKSKRTEKSESERTRSVRNNQPTQEENLTKKQNDAKNGTRNRKEERRKESENIPSPGKLLKEKAAQKTKQNKGSEDMEKQHTESERSLSETNDSDDVIENERETESVSTETIKSPTRTTTKKATDEELRDKSESAEKNSQIEEKEASKSDAKKVAESAKVKVNKEKVNSTVSESDSAKTKSKPQEKEKESSTTKDKSESKVDEDMSNKETSDEEESTKSSNINDDENMAAKFDLIKELAEEMLKENDDDEDIDIPSSKSKDQREKSLKSTNKRNKPDSSSSEEDRRPTKSAKSVKETSGSLSTEKAQNAENRNHSVVNSDVSSSDDEGRSTQSSKLGKGSSENLPTEKEPHRANKINESLNIDEERPKTPEKEPDTANKNSKSVNSDALSSDLLSFDDEDSSIKQRRKEPRKANKINKSLSSDEERRPTKSEKEPGTAKMSSKSLSSDGSSSDILMSSDDEGPSTTKQRRRRRAPRKEKEEKDKPALPIAKSKQSQAKANGMTKKDGKDSTKSKKDEKQIGKNDKDTNDVKKAEKKKVSKDKESIKTKVSKSQMNGKKDDDDDDVDKEIEKLSKMPMMKKRKAPKESDDEDDDEEDKEDDAPSKTVKTKARKNKPGPKSSKKADSFEDLSSDENVEKEAENYEDEDDEDEPTVTFCLGPNNEDKEEDELDQNEIAKNGLLEEIKNEKEEEDDDDDSDDSSSEEDSDVPKSKEKKVKKETLKKKDDDGDEEEEEDEDSEGDLGKRKKRKQIKSKLLDIKLSDSDSDVGTSSKKAKLKKKDEDFKEETGEKSSSGSSIESDVDDEEEEEDSEELSDEDEDGESKKKRKRKRTKRSKKKRKKKGKKGKAKGENDDDEEEKEDDDEEEDEEEEGGKKKGKGKKRRRIKKVADSSDEDGSERKKGSDDDSEDEHKQTPGGRKKIRKVMSNKKLEDSTRAAAKAEEKRRKRIAAKQREFNIETITDDNNPMDCPTTTKLILEPGKAEGDEPIVQVNKKLIRKLKPHQVEAVQFMWDCMYESVKRSKKESGAGCILAHCMGLGKTLSVISFVHTILSHQKVLGHRTALVVCPLNTVLNWQNEWTIWLDEEDQLEVWELASCKQNPARADMLKEWRDVGGIMIIGYEMYRNLTSTARIKNKRQKKMFHETLVDPGPDLVVCDEGHILKNEASAISKAMNLMKTRRRVVLTGTPLQNNLNEYHCMLSFVKPNLLGTRKEFNNRFISPIQNGQCTDSTTRDFKLMKARAHILHEMLAGCVQRRDYSALTKFLPPKQEYVMSVRLTNIQIDLYNKYLELSGQGVDGVFNNKGARLFKDYQSLMKIWTHPWVLKLAEIRDELKAKYDDEDSFIDDESLDGRSFSSSESSNEEKMSDSGEEGTSSGQKKGTRRTRAKARRQAGEDSDPEEVIAEWKSKSRGQDGEEAMETQETDKSVTNDWWSQFVTEDDQSKLELSNKLFLLFEILRMCEEIGDKVLIFSQSILSLNIIESFLETVDSKFQLENESEKLEEEETFGKCWTKNLDYYRMDGTTSAQNRQAWAQSFNDLDNYRTRLFLISTKAGGLGINLVAANRVIIFDASWNPSHDVQSIFRVYRFGQTKPCYIYRFLAQGTMEEKIYERQVTKLSLSQRVVDEHQIERHFSASDLKELYTFRPDKWDDGTEKPTLALPKDPLLAEILTKHKHTVLSFHEHDSLLENQIEQTLTEEEKKAAWEEYENEKKGIIIRGPGMERTASWPMMAAAQILSREQITATVQALRQQLPNVSEDLFQLHVQQALRRMVQLKQEEMRRMELFRMQEMNYINMMKQGAGLTHAESMAALQSMQGLQGNMAPWLQIQRLRAMQAQMSQGMGAGSSMMSHSMMGHPGMSSHRLSNNPEDAIDLDDPSNK